ncbi:MAG: hypothetical protein JWM87_3538 [Candidatus Eremiobacteraeota bacterium]|nr:hypothetical protein [Candidatus Eremiobacteraeota bacterium]
MASISRSRPAIFCVRRAVFTIAFLALTGCHADVTERLDFSGDGSGTMTVREVMDEQFAQMARSQSQDPFGIEQAKKKGWDVEQTLDDNGNHVVTMRHLFAKGGANDAFHATGLGEKTDLGNIDVVQSGNPFSTTVRLRTTIPRLLPKDRSGNPWATAGESMAASIVSIHLVISAPGRVDDTNGERANDGSVRWNVSLTEPTTIAMTVTYLNVANFIMIGAIVLVAVVAAIVAVCMQRRRPSTAYSA